MLEMDAFEIGTSFTILPTQENVKNILASKILTKDLWLGFSRALTKISKFKAYGNFL